MTVFPTSMFLIWMQRYFYPQVQEHLDAENPGYQRSNARFLAPCPAPDFLNGKSRHFPCLNKATDEIIQTSSPIIYHGILLVSHRATYTAYASRVPRKLYKPPQILSSRGFLLSHQPTCHTNQPTCLPPYLPACASTTQVASATSTTSPSSTKPH